MTPVPDRSFARELFARYPGTLALPWVELGEVPTPVERLDLPAAAGGPSSVWVKRDDRSARAYGGNKVRKLEFLLGDALAAGATDVITFGAAGSNHALATAIFGARLGMRVHSMLLPQPNARYVARNLAAAAASGADLRHYADRTHLVRATARLRRTLRERTGREPYVIPFGGTTSLSTVGLVSAGLEIGTQVEYREMPEPDVAFVALGSMGTAAGLALGLRAAGLRTRVVGVPVVSYEMNTADAWLRLVRETQDVLHAADPTFPTFTWAESDVEVATGFLGDEYARFTPEGMAAVRAGAGAGMRLEGTYTGKTFAALLAKAAGGALAGATVLFCNTYSSADISALVGEVDPARMPPRLREYATAAFQPLDEAPR